MFGNISKKCNWHVVIGYGSTFFAAVGPIFLTPFYFKQFGPEAWGMIAVVMLLQVLLASFEAGLTQGLSKEFSENLAIVGYNFKLKKALLLSYTRFVMLAGVLLVALSPIISKHLLKQAALSIESVFYIGCAFGLFCLNFYGSIYKSILIGAGKLAHLGLVSIIANFLRFTAGLLVAVLHPTPSVFLTAQLSIGVVELMLRNLIATPTVGSHQETDVSVTGSLAYAQKISGLVFLGVLVVNLDKLVVSSMLTLRDFGVYAVATSFAIGISQFMSPLCQAYFSKLVANRDDANLLRLLNRKLMLQTLSIVAISWIGYGLLGQQLIKYWLHNSESVVTIYPLISVLLIGTTLNAVAEVGYTNWIAFGETKYIAAKNIVSLLLVALVLPAFVFTFGLIGAAISWILSSAVVMVLTLFWLIKGKKL